MTKEYRFLGKAAPRKDAVEIVTGRAQFINDIKLPNMLCGKVLRSPYPHANIKSIDTGKARKLAGVKAVLTYQDVPDWKAGNPPHIRILDNKVRAVGDSVALVAAETEEIAYEALELIDVEYEPLPAVYDAEEAAKPDAPQLYEQIPGNIFLPYVPAPAAPGGMGGMGLQNIIYGDVGKGFNEADVVTEATFVYENFAHPLPPEPPGVIAAWEGPNAVRVWLSGHGLYGERRNLYNMLGGEVDVRVTGVPCGASYGVKSGALTPITLRAIVLAKAAGRPVKLYYTQKENLAAFIMRFGSRIHGRVGMKKDGTVTAIEGEWLVNTGYYQSAARGQVAVGLGEAQLMVRCNNWAFQPKIVCTNRNGAGRVRGFGGQELKCALIPLLGTAMEKLDIDPFEFFKKNFVKSGDGYYWRDGKWYVSRVIDFSKCMDKGAEAFGWKEKWKGWLKPTTINGSKRVGVGVGVHGNADVGEAWSERYVRLDAEPRAVVYSTLTEHGTGQNSSLCKMAAEVLQLPLERVFITAPDPGISGYDGGPGGSDGTWGMGGAVVAAAEDALHKLFNLAAPKFDSTPEDLETKDGVIFVRGNPDKSITWRDAMGLNRTCLGYGCFEQDFTLTNFMMTFVEVEVDVETGKVELRRVVNATDIGQIIDPPSLENQLNGCFGSGGIDSALFEESVLETAGGRILNANMIDYKWRTFTELPEIRNVILETPFPTHSFGAIGVGEITTAPGPPAAFMAVSNAIGTRLYSYPATPERVLRALGRIKGRGVK